MQLRRPDVVEGFGVFITENLPLHCLMVMHTLPCMQVLQLHMC